MTEDATGRVSFGPKEWIALLTPTMLLIGGAIHLNVRMSMLETAVADTTAIVKSLDGKREETAANVQRLNELERRVNSLDGTKGK